MTPDQPPGGDFVRIIDLETTGQSFTDGGVVELGWQDVTRADGRVRALRGAADGGAWALRGAPGAVLVNPGHPISPSTSAIHHIVDEDVAAAPTWPHAAPAILRPEGQGTLLALAAHRSAFEQRWCTPSLVGHTRWVCTYKCALRLWPHAPTHSNQGLRYWHRPVGLDRATGLPAHRAGPDAYVTAHLLRDMLAMADLAQLLAWSAEPALLVRVPFGPFRGRAWRDLDDATLDRIAAGETGGNADIAFSARHEQARRGAADAPAPDRQVLLF